MKTQYCSTLSSARLKHLANMRAAKARIRQKRMDAGWTPEPRMRRDYPIEIGFRDTRSGEVAFTSLQSALQASRLAGIMLQQWFPTPNQRP